MTVCPPFFTLSFVLFIFPQSVELLMRYFVGTELGVANVIQRHFNVSYILHLGIPSLNC